MPNSPSPLRILGIDPGLNITGYGVLEVGDGAAEAVRGGRRARQDAAARSPAGCWKSTRAWPTSSRLHPAVMALEQLYSHYQRPRTAILMGHARGVICLAAAQAGIPVVHYAATQVKQILTGAGRAGKAQVQRAIQRELALPKLPEPPDVADALAIACAIAT